MQIKNVRFIIAAITTLSAFAVYVSRVNLSIAIIAMVDDSSPTTTNATGAPAVAHLGSSGGGGGQLPAEGRPEQPEPLEPEERYLSSLERERRARAHTPTAQSRRPAEAAAAAALSTEQHAGAPLSTIFPASGRSVLRAPLISQEKFRWDQTAQGHIMGAFFYGYIIFQIPGARMAERVGARWILMSSTAGSALVSLIFPLSTQLNSIHLLMVLRFAMGLCQSAFFPAAYVFFCRWLPESERSLLLPIMFIGSNLGSISTYIMSSYLIGSSYGWPSVFYVSGLICLLVTLLWMLVGSNGPEDNWLITRQERAYILTSIGRQRDDDEDEEEEEERSSAAAAGNLGLGTVAPARRACDTSHNGGPCCRAPTSAARPPPLRELVKLNQLNRQAAAGELLVASRPQISHIRHLHGKLNKSKSANDLIPAETAARLLEQQQQVIKQAAAAAAAARKPHSLDESRAPLQRPLSWLKVARSVPIWVLILSMYGNEWSQVVLTYELPTYLNKALRLPIERNGVINSFFQLSYLLASPIMSSLGACMLERRFLGMRKLQVRKLFQSLATFGQMACFISVPICGPNEGLIITFMFAAIVLKACANAGDIMIPGDLSPEFAGTIFAFANSIGNTAGVIVPYLAGLIVADFQQRDSWTPFWLTSAAIMAFSGLTFLLLGATKRQDFALSVARDPEANGRHASGPSSAAAADEKRRPPPGPL